MYYAQRSTAQADATTYADTYNTTRTYFIERTTDLRPASPFLLLSGNIMGQSISTTYTDTNGIGPGPFLYRVGVQ